MSITVQSSVPGEDSARHPDAAVTIRHWAPRRAPSIVPPGDRLPDTGVLHFEVKRGADPDRVYDQLRPICGAALNRRMVHDLLEPDLMPRVIEHDEDGCVRAVSAFAARAIDPPPHATGCSGRLAFEIVEFLSNGDWLVTCAHEARSYAGGGEPVPLGQTCAEILRGVARRWVDGGFETAGELGVLMLHELTCSYANAWRALAAWLDGWERVFYEDATHEPTTLKELRGLASEFRARLNAINVPRDEAGNAWFGRVNDPKLAGRADRNIDRALAGLDRLSDMLRSAFAMLQANATTRQLQIAQEQQVEARRQQEEADEKARRFERIGAFVLVPTLVAGMWGENTWVPGEKQPWGFVLTLTIGLLGAWLVLKLAQRSRPAARR